MELNKKNTGLKSELTNQRKEGFFPFIKKVFVYLRNHTGQGHAFLWKYCYETGQTFHIKPKIDDIELKEVQITDKDEIEEITEKDEWGLNINLIMKDIEDGHRCFVIKHEGQIVASNFVAVSNEVWDRIWARSFKLGKREAYGWQSWCIPAYRGKGIMPFLILSTISNISKECDKPEHIGWTWVSNKKMHRSLLKIGFKKVGRLGFIEFFGIRFSYIWGSDAFQETRNRYCLHIPILHRNR
jgi:GNAT superfamily N-acetyltransferase